MGGSNTQFGGTGPQGPEGKSAYQIWLDEGNIGSEQDFLDSLVGSGDLNYVHNQPIANTTWNVAHNLGKFPSVTIIDTGGNLVEADVTYVDNNNLTLTFNTSYAGVAYIN